MRIIPLIVSIILAGSFFAASDLAQSQPACVIEGTAYDISDQLITGFRVAIEDMNSGEVINLRTDNRAHYAAQVPPGQYRVIMRKNPVYPIEYIHSTFTLTAGEKVSINFRPLPFGISDSIENGKWHEEYDGVLPIQTTKYIKRRDGIIRDLQIQSVEVK